MRDLEALRQELKRIDGRGYKAYKDLRGSYQGKGLQLFIDYVQGDPFASPSKLRLRVPLARAALPGDLFEGRIRRLALQDFLARRVRGAIRSIAKGQRGTGKSGRVEIDAGGQEVLERTALYIHPDTDVGFVEARIQVGLPAAGRRVLGREADAVLIGELPEIARASLEADSFDLDAARDFVECVENQAQIRAELAGRGLIAFVADGSLLPRQSGVIEKPLAAAEAVRFQSPESLAVDFELPNPVRLNGATTRRIRGMGIPTGVTLIVGGGYHGKSTLLRALERGVYPHIPGDGREYVVSQSDLVKIRAEDGRRVERVDIGAFIADLPRGRSTQDFCTDDASGSTSQAANIVEALELGATGLLLDEDTSATNFMVRDARMQALVHKQDEPITPFVDRVKELHESLGVSTVLVMGGVGDYFDAADHVLLMREYAASDVTQEAKRIAAERRSERTRETRGPMTAPQARIPAAESFDASRGRREVKIDAAGTHEVRYGRDEIDLHWVEQLVDRSQTRAVGYAIHWAASQVMDGKRTLREVVEQLDQRFDAEGLGILDPFRRGDEHPGNFARPRRHEIAAAINRLRSLKVK